jgi:hypothetical protein
VGYKARVFEVLIASPSDVASERRIIRDVVSEWNAVNAKDRHIVLMAIGWETHATPEMGDRPQAVINKQLLKDADLLIAAFWTRIGSPTGVAASGTVEEIEEHIRAGRPAMIYFSAAPVRMDSTDQEQYSALKAFKQSLRERGLIEEYEDLSEFRAKLTRQLAQKMIAMAPRSSESAPEFDLTGDLVEVSNRLPRMGDPAKELLMEASKDQQGAIMSLRTMQGAYVQTNGRSFATAGNPRSEAQWRGAVEELEALGLIEDMGGKREVFSVTDEGYRIADLMQQQ